MSKLARIGGGVLEQFGLNEWGERQPIEGSVDTELVQTRQAFPENGIEGGKIESLSVAKLTAGVLRVDTSIASSNYVPNVSGFYLESATGNVEFNNGTFRGTITATTGTIGGFEIGTDYIRDVANSMGLASTVTGGDDVRFWAGDTFANRATAPVNITEGGVVNAKKIVITTADSTVNGSPITLMQPRAENLYTTSVFLGSKVDGLGTTVTTGGITRGQINTTITGGSGAATGIARMYTSANLGFKNTGGSVIDWDVTMELMMNIVITTGSTSEFFFGFLDNTVSPASTNGVLTTRHIGFFVKNDNSIIASCANGTTQTTSTLSGVTLSSQNTYRIVWTTATSAVFYVNDVQKASLSTNLPSGATNPPDLHYCAQQGSGPGGSAQMLVKNNYQVIATIV